MAGLPTAEQRLQYKIDQYIAVNELITRLLSRETVKGAFNGREYTLHNVSELIALRDKLEVEAVGGGAMRTRAIIPRG